MPFKIAILGAGLAGVATAFFLRQYGGKDLSITCIEKSGRPGGWVHTDTADGFLFEQGPRSCRSGAAGQSVLELVRALGLEDEWLPSRKQAQNRYLYYRGKLQAVPNRLHQALFSPLCRGWAKALWRDWNAAPAHTADETIESFFTRHLGASWSNRLIDPLVSGIYAGDPARLSIQSCFPNLYQSEKKWGSLLKGTLASTKKPLACSSDPWIEQALKTPIFSFVKGMERLIHKTVETGSFELLLNTPLATIQSDNAGVSLLLENGKTLEADLLVSALPARSLAPLLPSHSSEISSLLRSIPYATVLVVNVGYRKKVLEQQGFGYLVPYSEGERILGCTWDSCIFPEQNEPDEQRLTMMLGGTRSPWAETLDFSEAEKIALDALERHLHITAAPAIVQTNRAFQAIAQYEVGHLDKVNLIKTSIASIFPRLLLTGSSFEGVSLNEVVFHAKKTAFECICKLSNFS